MPDKDITPVQRSVLLILMAEAREISNADLTKTRKIELKKDRRDNLASRGLIKVRMVGRFPFLELTEGGWGWCREQLDAEVPPPNAGHGGAAAYALMEGLKRYLDRHNLSLAEFFGRPDDSEDDVETRIRKAYGELAANPGAWVKLADLRQRLGTAARSDVDDALTTMNRGPDVSIVPESNQKTLTADDRTAAVRIGNQDRHVISIGS